jgi:hypothetical protein
VRSGEQTASGSLDTRELSLGSTRNPRGVSVQRLHSCTCGMAEGIREGKSINPDFDVAVERHQLLDLIQKASDTGIRQTL